MSRGSNRYHEAQPYRLGFFLEGRDTWFAYKHAHI